MPLKIRMARRRPIFPAWPPTARRGKSCLPIWLICGTRFSRRTDARDAETEAKLEIEFDEKLHPKVATEGVEAHSPIEDTNLTRDQLDEALTATVGRCRKNATDAGAG